MPCPKCGEPLPADAKFCESCGAKRMGEAPAPPAAPCRCGAGPEARDAQGYCADCGRRWNAAPPAPVLLERDHIEVVLGADFAAVTDRGRRHPVNEDDVALALNDRRHVIVVCDGVSSSQNADAASRAAALAARDVLAQAEDGTGPEAVLTRAVRAAHAAACDVPYDPVGPKDPPGATLVAALVGGGTATVAWVGDSRAYRLGPAGAALLTRDHSWVNEMVDAGQMTEEEATHSRQAHAITRCLGPLNGEEPEPSLTAFALPPGARLLLCTDGLWNYAPAPEQLAALAAALAPDAGALALCRRLVDFALAQGGRDNITAAVLQTADGKDQTDAIPT